MVNAVPLVLTALTLHVLLEAYLDQSGSGPIEWQRQGAHWMEHAEQCAVGLRAHEYRRAIALLYLPFRPSPSDAP